MFSKLRLNQLSDSQASLEPRTMLAAGSSIDNANLREHNFDDGNAFFEPASQSADDALAEYSGGKFIPRFDQDLYEENDGSRGFRGTALRGGVYFQREGYAGWNLTIPEDYPSGRRDVIHQWFNWAHDPDTPSAWTQLMVLKDNDLYLVHRPAQTQNQTAYLIAEDLPKGEELEFRTAFRPGSADVASSRVWLNEVEIATITGHELGWGTGYDHGSDGYIIEEEGSVAMKMGMYSIDASIGDNPSDVNRSLIFDNISNGKDDENARGTSASMNDVDPNRDNRVADFDYTPPVIQTEVDAVGIS